MRTRAAPIAAGISTVVAVGGGSAYAAVSSSAVDSSGVIHGCVSNGQIHGTHILVVHDVGTPCRHRDADRMGSERERFR
jgi:xanthine/CO dehydrogenase XdhC/CoxF family maturation factor